MDKQRTSIAQKRSDTASGQHHQKRRHFRHQSFNAPCIYIYATYLCLLCIAYTFPLSASLLFWKQLWVRPDLRVLSSFLLPPPLPHHHNLSRVHHSLKIEVGHITNWWCCHALIFYRNKKSKRILNKWKWRSSESKRWLLSRRCTSFCAVQQTIQCTLWTPVLYWCN